MTVQIPPGFAQVFARFTAGMGTHQGENVFGVALTGPPSQSDVNDLSQAFSDVYTTHFHTASSYDGAVVLVGQDGGDPLRLESFTAIGNGTQSSALAPPQVQGLIIKSSQFAGRRNKGRTFVPDMKEANIDDVGNINGTEATRLNDLAAGISGALSTLPFNGQVLLHSSADDPTPVISYAPAGKVATLRRRFER